VDYLNVAKPIVRSSFRRKLGKQFYIWKRKWKWLSGSTNYARATSEDLFPTVVKEHKSFLLRPLKDVQMQLQHNKIVNLRLAIRHIHKIVLRPGEVFSFWRLVGEPSERKGYLPGLILHQGNIEEGIGGGLCQLGNLIYWMAIHSPLTVAERYRHGYDVFPDVNRSVPFGAGATLSYNYIDIQLKNETDASFQLCFWLSEEYLHGAIRSGKLLDVRYEVYESDHRIIHQSWGGYTRHNRINRKTFDTQNNQLLSDELLVENHAIMMYEPLLTGYVSFEGILA
jgi:vancomycin resistance protein VanW